MNTDNRSSFITPMLLSVAIGLLTSCNSQNASSPPSPIAPASPQPASPEEPTSIPSPQPTTPPIPTGQDIGCSTPTHFAEVTWQTGQPRLTFGRKPDGISLYEGSPVTVVSNSDGSRTYGYQGEFTAYARFYLNGQCFVQTLDKVGTVVIEETGQTGAIGAVRQLPPPSPTPQPPRPTPPITEEPNQDNLSLICAGNIQNRIDFTAYYNRESGFYRVDLRPRTSNATLTSTLSYSGKNNEGQGIWRGSVNGMADVTLVHLSSRAPQWGDEISVGYDSQWGRTTCR